MLYTVIRSCSNKRFEFVVIFHSIMITSTLFFHLQSPLVQAIFNRDVDEVKLFLHKKDEVNALVCSEWHNISVSVNYVSHLHM